MDIVKESHYNLISTSDTSFTRFIEEFDKKYEELKTNHLIIEISSENNFSLENILVFLNYAESHRQIGMSFVILSKDINVESIPEALNIVPTLIEAADVIHIENLERDLGF